MKWASRWVGSAFPLIVIFHYLSGTQELVLDAILMAVRRRKPQNVLIHSYQGSQFGSDAWPRFCHEHHLQPSMSRGGNCCDNAVA
jgi:putative transposase